jgi:small subunit ribosomal protein S21
MSLDKRRPTKGTTVIVRDDQVEKALRKFKKKIQDSGKLEELRERESYEKPTTARRLAKNKAVRRQQKQVESDEIAGKRVPRDGKLKRMY